MDTAAVETCVALEERVAEKSRVIAWRVDAVKDFESLGAESAAGFGW